MNALPTWVQIIIGILSATNFIGVITLIVDNRRKNQELKEERLQRLNDNLLQNTRPYIDPLYIPINKLLSRLESSYNSYKIAQNIYHCYEAEKNANAADGIPEVPARREMGLLLAEYRFDATLALSDVIQELREYQEKMIAEGTIAFLTADFEKRFDSFLRFLDRMDAVIHTYLWIFQGGKIEQPRVFRLGEAEFEKELYGEINFIRAYIRDLALGMTVLKTVKPPTK